MAPTGEFAFGATLLVKPFKSRKRVVKTSTTPGEQPPARVAQALLQAAHHDLSQATCEAAITAYNAFLRIHLHHAVAYNYPADASGILGQNEHCDWQLR